MLKKIVIAENIFEPTTWETVEVEDVVEYIMQRFPEWPDTARIYHRQVAQNLDVTPFDAAGVEKLKELEGPFFIMVYPGTIIQAVYVIVAILIAVLAVALAPSPKIPTVALKNTQNTSPNNELSERKNKPRPNARIPDIYGTVRSTPDLLTVPYSVYQNHQEVEYCYMCIGRGTYEVSDICDDTTAVGDIFGTSVEVFGPYTSPNYGTPQQTIGSPITEPIWSAFRSNAVNGQVMRPPNGNSVVGSNNIRFNYPDQIEAQSGSNIDFTSYFQAGDTITVTDTAMTGTTYNKAATFSTGGIINFSAYNPTTDWAVGNKIRLSGCSYSTGTPPAAVYSVNLDGDYVIASLNSTSITLVSASTVNSAWNNLASYYGGTTGSVTANFIRLYNLSGTYTILSLGTSLLTLNNPPAINSDWNYVNTLSGSQTPYRSPTIIISGSRWVGPFILDYTDLSQVFCNFVALNGLYKDDGRNQVRMDVTIEVEITPVNGAGTPIGSPETFTTTVLGSATTTGTRAITVKCNPTFTGRMSIRARRTSNTDLTFQGTVVDEVKWKDMYGMVEVSESDFGDITTVHSVTYATAGALAVKERKLNMLVTRKIPQRISGSIFTSTLYATSRADEIIAAISLDPVIGNRSVDELDFDNIYDTVQDVEDYFGTPVACEFNYTFDNDNISYEEMISSIAAAIHCEAYRRGNKLKLSFEQETEISALIFNHRNKIPGSEKRQVSFGYVNDNDGVSYEYTDPTDDSTVTFYVPEDQSAVNPKKVESIGIRNKLQARFLAYRLWNKIQFQRMTTDFQATAEAGILVKQDRVLVADNTRPDTQDGEVEAQDGLELTLSQDINFAPGETYTIFLQHSNATTEAISITPGSAADKVVLANPPSMALSLDIENWAKATYVIVGDSDTREQAFLLQEKTAQDDSTLNISAFNYDSRYYTNDSDFINGIVDEDGNVL